MSTTKAPTWVAAAIATLALLAGCSLAFVDTPEPVAERADVLPLSQGIEQRMVEGVRSFQMCSDCDRPTPKLRPKPVHPAASGVGARSEPASTLPTAGAQPAMMAREASAGAVAPTSQLQLDPSARALATRTDRLGLPRTPPPDPVPSGSPETLHFTVNFALNSAQLSASAVRTLHEVARQLDGARRVHVTGYTDDLGAQAPNDRLAAQRAVAVMLKLRQLMANRKPPLSVPAALTTSGRGLCCYLSANTTPGQVAGVGASTNARGAVSEPAGHGALARSRSLDRRAEIVVEYARAAGPSLGTP